MGKTKKRVSTAVGEDKREVESFTPACLVDRTDNIHEVFWYVLDFEGEKNKNIQI